MSLFQWVKEKVFNSISWYHLKTDRSKVTHVGAWNQTQINPSPDSAVLNLGMWSCLGFGLTCFLRRTAKPSPEFPKKAPQYVSTTARSTTTSSSVCVTRESCQDQDVRAKHSTDITEKQSAPYGAYSLDWRNIWMCVGEREVKSHLSSFIPEGVRRPQPRSVQESVHCLPSRAEIDHLIVLDQTRFLAIRHLFVCVL